MSLTLEGKLFTPAEYHTVLVHGIKNGKKPRNAIAGGCGTYVVLVCDRPASFLIFFHEEPGNRSFSYECFLQIKSKMESERLTENRCNMVYNKLDQLLASGETGTPLTLIDKAVIMSGI